jgi:type VI secretion system secreted protein Hcp
MPVYLKYGNITGEVTEPAHRGWIELSSVQWGVGRGVSSPTGGSAGRESGSSNVSEIVVTKNVDSASTALFRESLSGEGVSAVVDFVRDDGSVYLRVAMSGTLIASYTLSGSGDDATESLTLNFSKVEFKSTPGTPP